MKSKIDYLEDVILKKYDQKFNIIEQNILNASNVWKNKSRMWGDKTHRISSYIAMFSPALANFFIEKYTNHEDIVLDTFSGRGTTMLEARLNNRKAFALDLNPFAFVLSKSKSKSFNNSEILNRIDELEKEYNNKIKNYKWDKDLEIYYSKKNLLQLSFIKEKLGINWQKLNDIDNYILAITLGIMHGPMKKKGDTIYLSLSMSNHTSMSKNYVKKFADKHNLKRPEDNIFNKIKNRSIYIISNSKWSKNNGIVKYGNALEIEQNFPNLKPNLIFTSPPYLNIINYTNQNWIKMWLLGFDSRSENKSIGLDDEHKLDEYIFFIKKYLQNISKISSLETKIIMVIGDVKRNDKLFSFEDMWEKIKYDIPELIIDEIFVDNIKQNNKATNSMGSRAGKATRVDKIYVFKKIG